MPTTFIMPKFDMAQETATVVEWLKQEGDHIRADESVLIVETEKVTIEVPAPATGTLAGIRVGPGDVVPVATPIAYVLGEGESLPASPPGLQPSPPPVVNGGGQPGEEAKAATPVAARMAQSLGIDLNAVASGSARVTKADIERHLRQTAGPVRGGGAVTATPAARRLAREHKVGLGAVAGSGPEGRVQAVDVSLFARAQGSGTEAGRPAEVVPLSGKRRTIADRMQASFHDAPHIALSVEVDMTQAEATRARMNEHAARLGAGKVSLTALLVRIAGWALARHPYLNASIVGDAIHLWKDVNVGVAVAVPDGLVVPVVRDAHRLRGSEIVTRLQDLTERARAGRLGLGDIRDGTFTISNLGMFRIDHFRAILNPPESGILAVGRIVRRPVVIDEHDGVGVRPMMSITLSADHRVVDGVAAANFLDDMARALEAPEQVLY